jgi:hypothetical protein
MRSRAGAKLPEQDLLTPSAMTISLPRPLCGLSGDSELVPASLPT